MQYREYGRTGKQISVLSFGGMRFEKPDDFDGMAQCLLAAYKRGINYFDTAEGYMNGNSERIFGRAMPELRKLSKAHGRPFYISTKTFSYEESEVRKNLDESLERMNTDRIDFYHIWCILSWDEWVTRRNAGVLDVFSRLKQENLIGHVSLSTHLNGEEIERLVGEIRGVVDGLLVGYHAANFPYREQGVRAAGAAGLGVVTMNPLGGGLLVKQPDAFNFIRSRPDQPILEAALSFNVSSPGVTSALVGMRNVADVESAADAMERAPILSDADRERVKTHVREDFNQLCTGCRYCEDCPEGIPVPKLMETYSRYRLTGGTLNPVVWLKYHWGIESPEAWASCIRCRQCEENCTQRLPILERLDELKKLYDHPPA